MKAKKFACLLVALLAVTAQFTACGEKSENTSETGSTGSTSQGESVAESGDKDLPENFNPTGERICPEPITVTVTGRQGATKDWQNTYQVQYIKDTFGIDLQCNPFPNDAWESQMALMLSTDEMPDVVLCAMMKPEDVTKYGMQGYFLPINQYLEYMPNLSQILEEYPEYKAFMTSPDDNIYGLTRISTSNIDRAARVFINETWLDNVGMEYPSTLDELTEVLRAFKEQDANGNGDPNDEIPMGYQTSMYYRAELPILSAFGINTFSADYILTETDGTVSCANNSDEYKEFLRYMHMLYTEGLMDQDAFVQTQAEFESKARNEQIGFAGCYSAPYAFAGGKDLTYDRQWSILTGLTQEEGQKRVMPMDSPVNNLVTVVINSNTEHPEALARLFDYFYTPEGNVLAMVGVDGETYDGIGEQPGIPGSEVTLPIDRDFEGMPVNQFNVQKGFINTAFWLMAGTKYMYAGMVEDANDEVFYDIMLNGEDVEGLAYWGVLIEEHLRDDSIEKVDTFPRLSYTIDEASERANLVTDITSYIQLAKSQFIIGELDIDKDWDTYTQTLEQMGLSRLVEIEQAAYDRMFK